MAALSVLHLCFTIKGDDRLYYILVHCLPSDHGSLCGLKNEVCVCVRVSALSDKKAFLSSAAFRRRAAFTAIRSGMWLSCWAVSWRACSIEISVLHYLTFISVYLELVRFFILMTLSVVILCASVRLKKQYLLPSFMIVLIFITRHFLCTYCTVYCLQS